MSLMHISYLQALLFGLNSITSNSHSSSFLLMSPTVLHVPSVAVSLKPDLFEGLKFDFSKPLNMNFAVTHSIYMGNVEMPMGAPGATLKVPVGTYEFGANLISSKVTYTVASCVGLAGQDDS